MNPFSAPSLTISNAKLLDLLSPTTGPITDLVLVPMEEAPGAFAFSAVRPDGEMVDGMFAVRCRWSDLDLLIDLDLEVDRA
jgi:hypothetical protein